MGYGMPKEAAETTIRVPHGLKDDLNDLKDKLYAGTPHEAIRKLIEYRERSEKQKIDMKVKQEREMLEVGENGKKLFEQLKEELGLQTDGAVLEFLAHCYWGTLQLPMGVFDLYKKMMMDGK